MKEPSNPNNNDDNNNDHDNNDDNNNDNNYDDDNNDDNNNNNNSNNSNNSMNDRWDVIAGYKPSWDTVYEILVDEYKICYQAIRERYYSECRLHIPELSNSNTSSSTSNSSLVSSLPPPSPSYNSLLERFQQKE